MIDELLASPGDEPSGDAWPLLDGSYMAEHNLWHLSFLPRFLFVL